jgi:hypothetical protein
MTWGYLIGTVIAGIIVLAGLVATVFGILTKPRWRDRKKNYGMWDDRFLARFWMKWGGLLVVVATFGFWVAGTFPPFQMKYHSYRPVAGTVQQIGTRFLGSGDSGGTTQMFVLTVNGQDYRCDDTRCSLVKVGDVVSMQCIGTFELHGVSGYRCNFVSDSKAAGS